MPDSRKFRDFLKKPPLTDFSWFLLPRRSLVARFCSLTILQPAFLLPDGSGSFFFRLAMLRASYDDQRKKPTAARGGERTRHARSGSAIHQQQGGLARLTGLTRSHAYLLYSEGKIDSVCIRRPGSTRGKRLWHVPSVLQFLNSCREGGRQ